MMLRDYGASPPEFTFMKDSITITNELLSSIEHDLLETRQYVNTRKENNLQSKELIKLLQDDNMILVDKVSNLEHILLEQTNQWKHANYMLSQECNEQLLTNQSEMERILLQCNVAINEKNDIENDLNSTKELCIKLSNELNSNKEIITQNKNIIDYLTLQNKEYALALQTALQRCSELENKAFDYHSSNFNHVNNNNVNNNNVNSINSTNNDLINENQSIDNYHQNIAINNYNNMTPSAITASTSYNDSKLISLTEPNNGSKLISLTEPIHYSNNITTKNTTTTTTTSTSSSNKSNSNSSSTPHTYPIKASSNTSIYSERQLVSPTDTDTLEAYEYIAQGEEPFEDHTTIVSTKFLSDSLSSKEVFESIQSELMYNTTHQYYNATTHHPISYPTTNINDNSNNDLNYSSSNKDQPCHIDNQHAISPYVDNKDDIMCDDYPEQYRNDGEPFETSYYDAISYEEEEEEDSNSSNNHNHNDNFSNSDSFEDDSSNKDNNNDDVNNYDNSNNDYGYDLVNYQDLTSNHTSNQQLQDIRDDYNSNYDNDSLDEDFMEDKKHIQQFTNDEDVHKITTTSSSTTATEHNLYGRCNIINFYDDNINELNQINLKHDENLDINQLTNSIDSNYCDDPIQQHHRYDSTSTKNTTIISIYDVIANNDDGLEQLNLEELSMLSL